MASATKKTSTKRRNKATKAGQGRKKKINVEGSTRSEAQLFGNVLK